MEAILSESNIPNMQSQLATIQQSQMLLQNAYKEYVLGVNGQGTPQGIVDVLTDEKAKNMQIQMDNLNQAEAIASTNLTNALTYTNMHMQAAGSDYASAVTAYNTAFSNAMQVQTVINGQANINQQNAAAYLSTISGLIGSGSLDPQNLPAATKASIATAELTAGWPIGTIENFTQMKPGANIVGSVNSVGANGNQVTTLIHQNADGSISTTNIQLPGTPTSLFGVLPGGQSGSGTSGTSGYTGSILPPSLPPTTPVSQVLSNPTQLSTLFATMAQAEGGVSAAGAQANNPLDLKYTPAMSAWGATDSGIKAQDGGTFAAFPDQATAQKAYAQQLSQPGYIGLTLDQALQKWSGYSGNSPGGTGVIQSWVKNIQNGNATIAQVPAGLKNAVNQALANTDTTSYSPLAASRFTMAANRIVTNYIQLPQYQLTANGLPYLQRIAAAMETPGSISDQDLLDSLTKLNTAGNAISDAQVKLITDGQSFSDMVGAFSNKFKNGGVLSDSQRQQIQKIATAIYANYSKGYQPVYDQATSQLQAAGIPQAFWTIPNLNDLNSMATGGGSTSSGGSVQQQAMAAGYDYSAMIAAGYTDAQIQAAIGSQ